MSKKYLLTTVAWLLLCIPAAYTQNKQVKILTVEEMFRLAEKNSRQLKLSFAGIEAAYHVTQTVKNAQLPSVDISLSASYLGDGSIIDRDFSNSERAPMPHFGNNFAIEASQVIFVGGSISHAISKARLQEQIAYLDHKKASLDIRFLLTGYYLDLYKMINQREVYLQNIKQSKLLIRQIKAKQEEGMALNNDITRHELQLKNLELAIIEIDNNCDILNHHMVITLGLPGNTRILPDTQLLDMDLSATTSHGLLEEAENNLPELKTASLHIQIAEKDIRMAQADYFPSIALVAANHMDGPITIEVPPINKNFNYWYIGIGLKYNLSSLFKSGKNVRLSKKQQQIAEETRTVLTEQTETNIHSSVIKYKESFEKLSTYEKSLELANENYHIINNRYINDLVLITEMLDASNMKLNAELEVVNAKINIIYSYYKLQRTIGKL